MRIRVYRSDQYRQMERRVIFSGWLCPAVLLLPQVAVTIVFFFWPAA